MVQGRVERIDGDPVQDPLLAWHRAIAPRTVSELTWEPATQLKDGRRVPAGARVTWFHGDDAFIAIRRVEAIASITSAIVVGLVTPRVREWKAGWQPIEPENDVAVIDPASSAHGAAVAVVPEKWLLAAFFKETIWYDLGRVTDWLASLSNDRARTQRLDPIAFPFLTDALTHVCMAWDPMWWLKRGTEATRCA